MSWFKINQLGWVLMDIFKQSIMIYSSHLRQPISLAVEFWRACHFFKNSKQTEVSLFFFLSSSLLVLRPALSLPQSCCWCAPELLFSGCYVPPPLPPHTQDCPHCCWSTTATAACPFVAAVISTTGVSQRHFSFAVVDLHHWDCLCHCHCCCCCFLTPTTRPLFLSSSSTCMWTRCGYHHSSALLPDLLATCCHHFEEPGSCFFLSLLFSQPQFNPHYTSFPIPYTPVTISFVFLYIISFYCY